MAENREREEEEGARRVLPAKRKPNHEDLDLDATLKYQKFQEQEEDNSCSGEKTKEPLNHDGQKETTASSTLNNLNDNYEEDDDEEEDEDYLVSSDSHNDDDDDGKHKEEEDKETVIADRKGKGILIEDDDDDDDDDDSSNDSDDSSDGDDDDLFSFAEVDLDNILPSRTRSRSSRSGPRISD